MAKNKAGAVNEFDAGINPLATGDGVVGVGASLDALDLKDNELVGPANDAAAFSQSLTSSAEANARYNQIAEDNYRRRIERRNTGIGIGTTLVAAAALVVLLVIFGPAIMAALGVSGVVGGLVMGAVAVGGTLVAGGVSAAAVSSANANIRVKDEVSSLLLPVQGKEARGFSDALRIGDLQSAPNVADAKDNAPPLLSAVIADSTLRKFTPAPAPLPSNVQAAVALPETPARELSALEKNYLSALREGDANLKASKPAPVLVAPPMVSEANKTSQAVKAIIVKGDENKDMKHGEQVIASKVSAVNDAIRGG